MGRKTLSSRKQSLICFRTAAHQEKPLCIFFTPHVIAHCFLSYSLQTYFLLLPFSLFFLPHWQWQPFRDSWTVYSSHTHTHWHMHAHRHTHTHIYAHTFCCCRQGHTPAGEGELLQAEVSYISPCLAPQELSLTIFISISSHATLKTFRENLIDKKLARGEFTFNSWLICVQGILVSRVLK